MQLNIYDVFYSRRAYQHVAAGILAETHWWEHRE